MSAPNLTGSTTVTNCSCSTYDRTLLLQHERPEDIRAACRQLIRGRHRDDEVWNAKLPLVGSHQQGRETRSIPLECALRDPLDDRSDLGVGEAALSEELSLSKFRLPRGHETLCRDEGNAIGSRLDLVICQQAEGSDLAGPMARGTVGNDDWCNILIERRAALRERRRQRRTCAEQQ